MPDGMTTIEQPTNAMEAILAVLAKANEITDPRMAHLNLAKATFGQAGGPTTGLTFYDLEPGAKLMYPVLTPLRNAIPRVSGKGGVEASWRAITAINTQNIQIGVSQGHRGGVVAVQTKDYTAAYRGIGTEASVNFEAQYAGQGFEDIRALGARTGLESLMLGEEAVILAGNGGNTFGVTPTPVCVGSNTGGFLANAAYNVYCVALTYAGYVASTVASGVVGQVTRTNADGSTDTFGGGSANKSVAGTATISGGGVGKITATLTGVPGASGYAWFWGTAGSELLGAITTVPTVVINAAATGSQNASAITGDNSVNSTIFSGMIQIAATSGSGSYVKDLGGAGFTSDNAGGIVEIDDMLKHFWDNYRLSPDELWVSAQELNNIGKKILGAGGAGTGAFRININQSQGAIGGGIAVASYLNKFSMAGAKVLDIKLHPNMAPGMVLAVTKRLPYPLSDVNNLMQIRCRQDYYQIEWPLITRQYQYGVYADEVLQHYFPPSLGIIQGVGNL